MSRNNPIFTLQDLADLLGAELKLSKELEISGLGSISDASSSQVSFCGSKKFLKSLASSRSGAILISPELFGLLESLDQNNFLLVPNPEASFAALTKVFSNYPIYTAGVHASASVHPEASLGDGVVVGPNAVVEQGAKIGDNCVIGAGSVIGSDSSLGANTRLFNNVNIYQEITIGRDCIIHSGAVIGSDGFGFAPGAQGLEKLYQLGSVIVGDRVEIGANTCIDRGALTDTRIGNGVKIDNLVHIAHNVEVGENTALAGCVGIAGSAKIGANCQFGGQVGVNGHISICDGVVVTGKGLVAQNITEPGVYSSGIPASKNIDWRRNIARFHNLNEMSKSLKRIEKRLGQLDED